MLRGSANAGVDNLSWGCTAQTGANPVDPKYLPASCR
jgi:hypothetical protein